MGHIHELIDWTVSVYIVCDNKVLLRIHEKYGFYAPPGGHIELNEDPIEAAVRECKEEVGLDVTVYQPQQLFQSQDEPDARELIPPPLMNIHWIGDTHQHIDLNYFARATSQSVVPENENDVWVWLSASELADHPDIRDRIKHYGLQALAALARS